MPFDYFYNQQADLFSFYRIPKILFTDRFSNISTDAKLLYGLLLDRMSLSIKNGWLDELGRVYIIYTLEEVQEALNCADQKATKLFHELEKKCGLIERKRLGMGRPNLIYVKNCVSAFDEVSESRFMTRENHDSGFVKTTTHDSWFSRPNNTDINDTDFSDTYPIQSSDPVCMESDEMRERKQWEEYFKRQLDYEILLSMYPYEQESIDEIMELIVDTVCTNRKTIRIAGDDKPAEVVKSQFMKLESEHIRYLLECFKKNHSDVRNTKQYLLAAIYNAPMTMSAYYEFKVRHDQAKEPP